MMPSCLIGKIICGIDTRILFYFYMIGIANSSLVLIFLNDFNDFNARYLDEHIGGLYDVNAIFFYYF
jgi:hypothetical protein